MDFKASSKSIDDVLRLQRKYVIPRFQREYSWEQEELSEMYDDLIENIVYQNNSLIANEYFIGSLVLVGDDDDTTSIERFVEHVDCMDDVYNLEVGYRGYICPRYTGIAPKKGITYTNLDGIINGCIDWIKEN